MHTYSGPIQGATDLNRAPGYRNHGARINKREPLATPTDLSDLSAATARPADFIGSDPSPGTQKYFPDDSDSNLKVHVNRTLLSCIPVSQYVGSRKVLGVRVFLKGRPNDVEAT
jgi:hypothetical protein